MKQLFKPLPHLSPVRALLVRFLMLPNFLLTRAEGLERLPSTKGPFIFAFNHNNSAEALMVPIFFIYHLGGHTISFVIDWMYGRVPVLGNMMEMIEPVYVYTKRSPLRWIESSRPVRTAENTAQRCCRKIAAGRSLGIFPEGKRNPNPGTLGRARSGIGHIALESGVPVIPVGIDFPLRREKGRIPVLGRTIIRIGSPMDFTGSSEEYRSLSAKGGEETLQRNRLAMDVTHAVMRRLSDLSGKEYHSSSAIAATTLHQPQTGERLCQV
ncbi:MAG TPA: 1-acyl-sn-glycerol-3-phosphate acyltransferase [Chlorobium sp.]|uniref:Phospholipid/glycerol acyltransferase n=1 Tax=Chlorobium phaeovibrioides (strain DSM 265 / 1930) TaxID=290318 RepID=A4SEV7_CHLPM|nr:1-acyl-sn-glycerol-3-phosphate acyltransferase [Chlorobium sp.]